MIRTLAILLALTAPVLAHGGMYLGPGNVPVPPGTTIPGAPSPGGPNTGGASYGDNTSWQAWWEHNKDPYLRVKEHVREAPAGAPLTQPERGKPVEDSLAPGERMRENVVLPALKRLLDEHENPDVQTACMVAMAKIGVVTDAVDPLQVFRNNLTRGNQEVRETAALCFGIMGLPQALDDLIALVRDERDGRALVSRSTVDHRTRAFAAYGVGLVAGRSSDIAIKQRAFEVLSELLGREDLESRDLAVALIQGIGLLAPGDADSLGKRLRWKCLAALEAFWQRDLSKSDQVVQAHVPTAIARLLGRGNTSDHVRLKKEWAEELSKRAREDVVDESIALALGEMALPRETLEDDGPVSDALMRYAERGKDVQTRYFCLIALAHIGGESNRKFLLERFAKGRKGTDKPWAALALGVLANAERAVTAKVDETIGHALLEGLREVANPEHRGAAAVALGLAGYQDAIPGMRELLSHNQSNEVVAGYLCIGLALLGADKALPDLRSTMRDSVRKPLLLNQSAIAIAVLGSKEGVDDLFALIDDGDTSLGRLAGIASAFRYVGDRRAAVPLVELLFRDGLTTLARAFVAAALGGIADKDDLPWNTDLSVGINYRAVVETLSDGVNGVLDIL